MHAKTVSSCNIDMKMKNLKAFFLCVAALAVGTAGANAQKYGNGLIDKSVAVVGEEMIKISAMEEEIKVMRANGMLSDKNVRCDLLEQMIVAKIFLMQARVDSLNVNNDMVESSLNARLDQVRTQATKKWRKCSASPSTNCVRNGAKAFRNRALRSRCSRRWPRIFRR